MHGEDSDCDEGDEHQEDTPAPSEKAKRKRVTKPSVAKTSVFGEEASTRTFTIPVKLAPRCLTVDVEKRLRECAEVISERAIWASRLANFVVEHFPGDFCTAFEQSNGQTFYGQLLSAMAGVKRHNPKATLLPKHLDEFHKTIPEFAHECRGIQGNSIPCRAQEPIRNQMAKDAVKHLKERMRDKLPLFIRHNLRKHLCVNAIHLDKHLQSGEIKRLVYLLSNAILRSACAIEDNDTGGIPRALDAFLDKVVKSRNASMDAGDPEIEERIGHHAKHHEMSTVGTVLWFVRRHAKAARALVQGWSRTQTCC